MSLPTHPAGTYVGLYGSNGAAWRVRCKTLLEAASVPWHDPTDARWAAITHSNGDENQGLIDRLVGEEHAALLGSGCVLFHLAGGTNPPASLASRCELGLLAGSNIPTVVHVDEHALGRNYVKAVVKRYRHLEQASSLDAAAQTAIALLTTASPPDG